MMKTDGRRIYTQAEGAQTNLVVELFQEEQLIPYCCKMMENNVIPGLLPVRHQILDGVYRMKYNLNGKLRLQDYLMQRQLDHAQGLTLLRNLTDSLLQLGEYFLSVDQCILDTSYIYVGDGLRTYLICLPLEQRDRENPAAELQDFYEKLLSSYFATADCTDYDEMFKWIYRASPFDLSTLRDKFLAPAAPAQPAPAWEPSQESPARPSPAAPPAQPVRPAPEPRPEPQRRPELEPPARAGVLNIPGGGSFAVPEAAPSGKKPKKEKPPKADKAEKKKGFWPFGSHGDKQKPAQPVPPAPAPQPAAPAHSAPAPQAPQENWERGTILVTGGDQQDGTVLARPGGQGGCYLVHNNARVDVTVLPFIIGQYNTTKHVDYAIYNNSNVSRQHATILMSGGGYMVQDNHSLNGTFVNGRRLAPDQMVPVADGDEIRLYNEVFVFHTK